MGRKISIQIERWKEEVRRRGSQIPQNVHVNIVIKQNKGKAEPLIFRLVKAVYDPEICNDTETAGASQDTRTCLIEEARDIYEQMGGLKSPVEKAFEMYDRKQAFCDEMDTCRAK